MFFLSNSFSMYQKYTIIVVSLRMFVSSTVNILRLYLIFPLGGTHLASRSLNTFPIITCARVD